jgi:CRP-like cAMP-binding protein
MVSKDTIKNYNIFSKCTDEELDTIITTLNEVTIKKNRTIYQQGDPAQKAYIIISGIVELNWLDREHDKKFHICLLQQGDIFGVGELFFDLYYINATTTTECVMCEIKKDAFFETFMQPPSVKDFIMLTFAHIVRQQTTMKGWHSARRLFSQFIFFLCRDHGTATQDRIIIHQCIKHEHIASILNLSREHVTRLFRQFKSEGIIIKGGKETIVSLNWYNSKKKEQAYQISFRRNFNTIAEFF